MKYAIALIALFVMCSQAMAEKPIQRLMIVEQSQQKAANEACVKLFGPKAEGTFSVAMEGPGKKVFYVCSWRLTDADAAKLKGELDKISGAKPQVMAKAKDSPKADEFTDARGKLKAMGIEKASNQTTKDAPK